MVVFPTWFALLQGHPWRTNFLPDPLLSHFCFGFGRRIYGDEALCEGFSFFTYISGKFESLFFLRFFHFSEEAFAFFCCIFGPAGPKLRIPLSSIVVVEKQSHDAADLFLILPLSPFFFFILAPYRHLGFLSVWRAYSQDGLLGAFF